MKKNIVIYSTKTCPYCERAKKYFSERQITFEERDLTNRPEELSALKERTGHMTVPQIFIDDQFIGGYSDLSQKVASGEILL